MIEAHRIDRRMLDAYPGVRADHRQACATELTRRPPLSRWLDLRDVLEALVRFTLGVPEAALLPIRRERCIDPMC